MTTRCRSPVAHPGDVSRSDGDERGRDDDIERETRRAASASIPAGAGADLEASVVGRRDRRAVDAVAARDDDVMPGRGRAARAARGGEHERRPEHEDQQMKREQRERQRALHDLLHDPRDSTLRPFEWRADSEK